MPIIKVNDINMYYEIHGEGFPFIMILGLSCDVNWWTPKIIENQGILVSIQKNLRIL